jgi:hypothetical protein
MRDSAYQLLTESRTSSGLVEAMERKKKKKNDKKEAEEY